MLMLNPLPTLELRSVVIGYAARALQRVNQAVMPGELTCILGPNGAGKSTLLRAIGRLQRPLSGEIVLHGKPVSAYALEEFAKCVSVVLTERVEVDLFSVYDVVALGRYPHTNWRGTLQATDRQAVEWALNAVGAEHLRSRNIHELSDGERQRVMIARALAQQPTLMLLDEPTAFLDLPHKIDMLAMLRRLTRQTKIAILLSTHDLDLALQTADNIWLFSQAGSLRSGAPEDLILSGDIEREFRRNHPDLTFDLEHGAFVMPHARGQCVALSGDGLQAHWTRKALAREGFQIGTPPSQFEIAVETENGHCGWQFRINGEFHSRHASIYELLGTLRNKIE